MVEAPIHSARMRDAGLSFLVACLAVTGICLQVLRWGIYTGDDINTLAPVAAHSLTGTIAYYIRPIEYFIVSAANVVWLPAWILVSGLSAVAAATIHVDTVERVSGRLFDFKIKAAVVAGSPVWFYTVSQVDTVSESLCNLAFAASLNFLARILFDNRYKTDARLYVLLNASAALLLYTKELAIGAACTLPAIGLLRAMRSKAIGPAYIASALFFAAALCGWILLKLTFRSQLPEAAGHYNLSPSAMDIVRNVVASLAFGSTPLPTSMLSIASLALTWTIAGVAATSLLAIALYRLDWRSKATRWFACAMVGSCAPMFYVHASELYASMIGTLLVGLMVAMLRLRPAISIMYCTVLLACSYANAYIYYHGADLESAQVPRSLYSVYFGPNGQSMIHSASALNCPVGRTAQVSCDHTALLCKSLDGSTMRQIAVSHGRCTRP